MYKYLDFYTVYILESLGALCLYAKFWANLKYSQKLGKKAFKALITKTILIAMKIFN